jgi:hypothetical protein
MLAKDRLDVFVKRNGGLRPRPPGLCRSSHAAQPTNKPHQPRDKDGSRGKVTRHLIVQLPL